MAARYSRLETEEWNFFENHVTDEVLSTFTKLYTFYSGVCERITGEPFSPLEASVVN